MGSEENSASAASHADNNKSPRRRSGGVEPVMCCSEASFLTFWPLLGEQIDNNVPQGGFQEHRHCSAAAATASSTL